MLLAGHVIGYDGAFMDSLLMIFVVLVHTS